MSIVMVCMGTTSAFATTEDTSKANALSTASQVTTDVSVDTEERALGKILASGVATINNGSGSVTVYLPSGHFSAYYIAQIGYAEIAYPVRCSVVDPDGYSFYLGTIMGTGATTDAYGVSYSPGGYYTFNFISASTTPYQVVVMIRE